jgi:hypothetical protein
MSWTINVEEDVVMLKCLTENGTDMYSMPINTSKPVQMSEKTETEEDGTSFTSTTISNDDLTLVVRSYGQLDIIHDGMNTIVFKKIPADVASNLRLALIEKFSEVKKMAGGKSKTHKVRKSKRSKSMKGRK